MDALTITAVSTLALSCLLPVYCYVVWRYYRAWRGGEPIPYFAPTVALLGSIAVTGFGIWFVAVCALAARYFEIVILPPGVGLLVIVLAFFAPAPPMLWLLRALTGKKT